ncbi:olfactory receptor 6N1-like [Conger conger]|uniref:olfactory receptor 6N1-like n=1 Tax=Conger conger TaxID=82655 RepID=UPI002A598F87|nr:olfactory receptor 6N1-like [Conger conger]
MENTSTVKVFTLSGLQDARTYRSIYFSFTLLIYLLIILVNLTVILIICLERDLHEPMYVLLSHLCVNGLCGTAGFYPKILLDILSDVHVILYSGCLAQLCVIYSFVMCEITLLTVMSYDRYVAICRPLQYHTIMTPLMVRSLLLYAWLIPISEVVVALILTLRLPLCGTHIDKLFCDNGFIMKLSCVPATINNMWGIVIVTIQFLNVFLVLYTYGQIVNVCLRSSEGRSKFMETCVPHLASIVSFIVATMFDYVYSRHNSKVLPLGLRNFMAVEFLVIPPLFNPIVYGLKMKKIRTRVIKLFSNTTVSHRFGGKSQWAKK